MAASLEEYYGLYLSEKYASTYAAMAKTVTTTQTTTANPVAPVQAGISGKVFTYGAAGLGVLTLILLLRK